MTNLKHFMIANMSVLLFGIFVSLGAQAVWTGTGTCCFTCSGVSGCGSGSETFNTQSDCLAREAQGTGVCQSYISQGCTVTSFTPGSCTASGLSASSSVVDLLQNSEIRETLGNFSGSTPTAGSGGLSQGLGTTNNVAAEQGQANFTKNANSANEAWLREAAARIGVNNERGFNQKPNTGFVGRVERAASFFTSWITPSQTLVSPLTGDSVPHESAEYQANYIGGVVIPVMDNANPPVNEIKGGGGQPITGVGVHYGPKDTPPPASPETPKVPQVQGQVHTGANVCRDKKWLFNSQTQMCYPSMKSCEAADKKGICQ